MTLEERLQFYRKREGMSQEDVAVRLNVTRQAVSKWETGSAAPDTETLTKLAKLYRVSLPVLITGDLDQIPKLPVDSLQWAPDHKLCRPAAAKTLQKLMWVCIALGAGSLILSLGRFFDWWSSWAHRGESAVDLWLCLGLTALFFLCAGICEAARSGLEALFVELSDQMENMERRFRMLRKLFQGPEESEH